MSDCTCPEWIQNSRELCPSCEKALEAEAVSWSINEGGFFVQAEESK